MPPHREDFIRWQDDPVTRWIMAAHLKAAEDCREAWMSASWTGGACSKEMLAELRTFADAYKAIAETTYEGFCELNGDAPNVE